MALKKDYIVVKNNMLNEMRGRMSQVEYRLFCIYLSRINPKDENTNDVRFSLAEYTKIMGLDRPRREDLERQAENIVSKTVKIRRADGGFSVRSLFISFDLIQDENGIWQINLKAHPDLMPYLFENKKRFFKYQLYNTLYLSSFHQMRLYELLKQYEKIGKRIIALEDLKEYLGLEDTTYPIWGVFSRDILKKAQKAIGEKTDISFTYKAITKVISGKRRTVAVEFIISKNENFYNPLQLEGFLFPKEQDTGYNGDSIEIHGQATSTKEEGEKERLALFIDALPETLSLNEVDALQTLAREHIKMTDDSGQFELDVFRYLQQKTKLLKAQKKIVDSKNYFSWLKKAVIEDWN